MRKYGTLVEILSFRPRNRIKTKKGHHRKLKSFCPRNQVKTKKKKKRYSPQFGTEFGRNLWELFALTGPSSVQPALKPG